MGDPTNTDAHHPRIAAEDASHAAGDLDPVRLPGPLRRNVGLVLVVATALMLGPMMSRYLSAYRAIVLEVDDGQALIAEEARPPRWINGVGLSEGQMIEKELGSWGPKIVLARGRDHKLTELYRRYVLTYEGVIKVINPPVAPGAASTAVVELDAGGRIRVPLWAEHLAAAAEGVRVKKVSGTWDPELVLPGVPSMVDHSQTSGNNAPSGTSGTGGAPPAK